MKRRRTPLLVQLRHFAVERLEEQPHEARDLLRRPAPVLAREGEQRERPDAALAAGLRSSCAPDAMPALWPAWRGRPRACAQRPLPSMMMAMCRGTVALFAAGFRRIALTALPRMDAGCDRGGTGTSLFDTKAGQCRASDLHDLLFLARPARWSISATYLSVSFWISSSPRCSSSCETSFSLSISFTSFITSRRTLRTRDARVLGVVTHHLGHVAAPLLGERRHRNADHRAGGHRRQPEIGLHGSPSRSACTMLFSQGETTSVRASSTLMLATCCSGTSEP